MEQLNENGLKWNITYAQLQFMMFIWCYHLAAGSASISPYSIQGCSGRGRRGTTSPSFCMKRSIMTVSIDVSYSRVSDVPHFVFRTTFLLLLLRSAIFIIILLNIFLVFRCTTPQRVCQFIKLRYMLPSIKQWRCSAIVTGEHAQGPA